MPITTMTRFIAVSILLLLLGGCDGNTDSNLDRPAEIPVDTPKEAATSPVRHTKPEAQYVGLAACTSCHQQEFNDWHGSHHDLAMQTASEQSVLGDFDDAKFTYNNITSTFYREGDQFKVRTDGPDGKLHDYTIEYTFGVSPLQQYLIEFDDGRVQALSIAWDSRPASDGGQRWFHLYPDQQVDFHDPLHWTARSQNWNFMCAECHSTELQKNYDFNTDTFQTTFSEINVSCEACHGPGSNHVDWAKGIAPWASGEERDKGLAILFDERIGVHWQIDPTTGNARRNKPRLTDKEIDTCAHCHSRRGVLDEKFVHGRPIGDTHRVALLDPLLYYPDGQPADETYVYGSFLQSKMYHKGVTCSDCHQPHSLDLKFPGDQVCGQCHLPEKYASPKHHFHPQESAGARCAECHMPVKNFMVVDARHDHSFRIPRPDLSVRLGTPNACTTCHSDKSNQWAADQTLQWYGRHPVGYQNYPDVFNDARNGNPAALSGLLALANNDEQPAIARATAVNLLATFPTESSLNAIIRMTKSRDPLVRRAAAEALETAEPSIRIQWLVPLLQDDTLDVRITAARALASVDPGQLEPAARNLLHRALDEYVQTQKLNGDRPESWVNLGTLYTVQREAAAAEQAYLNALKLDADYVPAVVNLADLYRATGRESKGAELLRSALLRMPDVASLHYALGLSLVRQRDYQQALEELQKATSLEPENIRFAYAHALALYSTGQLKAAMKALEAMAQQHPFDRQTLSTLVAYAQESGDQVLAGKYLARLQELNQSLR